MKRRALIPLETMSKRHKAKVSLTGFTLVEVMIAMAIFMIISGIVFTVIIASFRSFSTGQTLAQREQRKRFVFFRLSKELSSVTRISYPGNYLKGDENSFFLCITRRIS